MKKILILFTLFLCIFCKVIKVRAYEYEIRAKDPYSSNPPCFYLNSLIVKKRYSNEITYEIRPKYYQLKYSSVIYINKFRPKYYLSNDTPGSYFNPIIMKPKKDQDLYMRLDQDILIIIFKMILGNQVPLIILS